MSNTSIALKLNCTSSNSDYIDVFISVLMVTASFTAVFGNLAILILTYRYKFINANYLITNLAMTDFIVGAFIIPPFVVSIIHGCKVFLSPFCSIFAYITNVSTQSSILTVVFISLDRSISILKPFKYQQYVTTNRIVTAISLTWILSMLISAVPFFNLHHIGLGLYQYVDYLDICWINIHLAKKNGIYLSIIYTSVSVCLVLVFICYVLICREVTRGQNRIYPFKPLKLRDKMSLKITKTTIVVVGTYLCCNLPSIIMILNGLIDVRNGHKYPNSFERLALALVFTNSAVNPIIYILTNKSYRASFQSLIHDCVRYRRRQRAMVLRLPTATRSRSKTKSSRNLTVSSQL